MTANAYTVYFNTGNINWADSDAKFQVWTGSQNVDATKIGGNWYSFEVGNATGTMYFKRNSPTGDKWNEFNVSISSTNNCVRLTDWNKGEISSLHVTGDSWNGIGNWSYSNTAGKMIIDGKTFTKTFENVSSEAHKFKLTFKGTWDNAIGYSSNVSCVNGEVADDGGNIKFTPKVAGDVTITYNMADGKIVIECATPKYSVTTSASPAEGGVVSAGGIYDGGSSVTLTATPAEGYEFVNWTKGETVVSISKEYTFTVQEDVILVANFKVPVPDVAKYQVTASANDNAMGSVTGGGEYEDGATALLTATPNAGYQFVNWTVDETEKSTETTYSFTVTEDVEVVANFKEAEPEYQVIGDEITNFVFDTEAWPMVCQGGPSATYQIEVFLVLTEDADGTLSYEDCSVSIMGTDATFIEGTLSDLDVYAPSADAVLRVQWNGEFYELHLAMSAAAAAEPTNVLVTNAVKSYDEGSGALKLTGRWEGVEVFVEIGGYEGKESIEYSTPQGVLFETPDVAAFGNEASIIVAGEDITVVCNGLKPNMGNDVYNVTITTLSEVSTALDNLNTTVAPVKMIENGQMIIVKDGVQYNAQGAILK